MAKLDLSRSLASEFSPEDLGEVVHGLALRIAQYVTTEIESRCVFCEKAIRESSAHESVSPASICEAAF